ncbi:MBL fold metallo-hydrolase [Kocuria tytonis]|uniref:MBL fold metallo-hydrolase n=1 Tax=Kocuria tytonis TaxID=2054280 RepID=A0A495A9X3_9MICC|nr:MBL fold metallo-hydrolase [Kocuria tytonis]RKQ36632.1 MBL fold metallo-hydrolase [Kocuria tytonis]
MTRQPSTVLTDPRGGVTVQNCVTEGTFSLDGQTWDVENNVWVVGNQAECVVIDPAHDPDAVLAAVGGRTVTHVLLTHGHDDHIRAVREFVERAGTDAPVMMNHEDLMLWHSVYPEGSEPEPLRDGQEITAGTVAFTVLATPGHSPGSVVFHAPDLGEHGVVFTGDTLFQGGPGATGRSFSDFPTIIESIDKRLFTLPEDTLVLTGHGDATSIGEEKPHLGEWIARGH